MEAKTALELWNDGVEGRLNLQLYRCDIESLLLESEGGSTSSSRFDSTSYEPESFDEILRQCGMISPEPGFLDLDSSSEEEGPEDNKLEGRVTPPLRLFDHLDSPTYEELLRQNWDLFEDSDQEPECSYTLKDVPKDLELLDSPGVVRSVVPEPTCLTGVIQATVMHPSPKKVPKKRKKKNWGRKKRSRPPRKIMVSVENGDEVESEVEDAPEGIVGCESVQNSCQPKQSVVGSESSVHRKEPGQGLPWESLLGPPTTPRVLPKPSIAASEFFAEHFGYEPEPVSQKRVSPQTRAAFARPGRAQQNMTPLALEPEKSMPALGNSNVFPQKKRHASGNLSSDYERLQTPQFSASINIGFENVEPATRHAPRQHKRRRLVT